ncbi:MAG: hypothetical protein M3255_11335, partial [Pseudomonadota bacterium]|nr:hypothetical protein [Pseudomonadota bacterium]
QMSASGPDAELNYRMTLRALANDPHAAVTTVADIYRATSEEDVIALFPAVCSVRQWESTSPCEPDVWPA